jgi:hypothetical protein
MSIQDIDARLWQDPLEAIESKQHQPGTLSLYEKRTHSVELVRENLTKDATAPLILAVMVNGTGYPEKIERRLRDRVAVENALARAGYSPNDPEHLGSFTIPWSRYPENLCDIKSSPPVPTSSATPKTVWEGNIDSTHLALTAGPKASSLVEAPNRESGSPSWRRGSDDKALLGSEDHTPLTVPFELHKPDPVGMTTPPCDNVLVLWLRQNFFDDAPLARLAQLFSWFQKSDGTLCAKVKILGPDTSDSLLKLVQEVCHAKPPEWAEVEGILSGSSLFAFRPSASDKILLENDSARDGTVKALIEQGCRGLRFYRTTATDNALLKELKRELSRRHIKPRRDPIAIISEQDTLFARALPASFDLLLYGRREPPANVELLTYLRGIDGRTVVTGSNVPSTTSGVTAPAMTATPNSTSIVNQRGPREVPEGTDESDYIRRLASEISILDTLRDAESNGGRLRRKLRMNGAGIEAIGVLGSDIYDKLEILHALRPRLRAKVFFTTGLDARFYHPQELSATRNLVVVSGFGLSLNRYYQASIPPFRDHNQTAAFAAALCALGVMDADKVNFNKSPRVFEISKRGAIDLSIDSKSELAEFNNATTRLDPSEDIHPARHDLRNWWEKTTIGKLNWWQKIDWWRLAPGLSVLILIGSVLFGRRYVWSDRERHSIAKSTTIAIAVSILLILAILAPLYYWQRLKGEPVNLFEGDSMWPSEAIRLLVFFLSVHFVVRSLILLKENEEEIAPAFGFNRITPVRVKLRDLFLWKSKNRKEQDIRTLWGEYLYRSQTRLRLIGTFFWFVLYVLAVSFIWMGTGNMSTPARGNLMFNIDVIAVLLAMAFSTFLTLFVMHATLLDARFTRVLSKWPTKWPLSVRKKHQQKGIADVTGEYLDVVLIARRTRAVTKLIYYPLITISLIVICRLPEFDNFDWPITLILILCFNGVLACGCVLILRGLAETVRREALKQLREHLMRSHSKGNEPRCAAIEGVIQEIQELDEGIFAPITRQPVVGAVLLPSASAGVWALLQYFH